MEGNPYTKIVPLLTIKPPMSLFRLSLLFLYSLEVLSGLGASKSKVTEEGQGRSSNNTSKAEILDVK